MKSSFLILALLLSAILMFAGCSGSDQTEPVAQAETAAPAEISVDTGEVELPGEPLTEVAPLIAPTMPAAYGPNDWEVREQVKENNPVEPWFAEAVNAFAYQTAAQALLNAEENRNFSPISLYYALALTATGTQGNTNAEVLALLGADDLAKLSAQSGNLFRLLYTDNDITKLKMANSLWLDDNFSVNDAFIKNAVEQFYAWIYTADFLQDSTAQAVSQWIKANTGGTIEPEIELTPDMMMLIINTVYFYDEWLENFDKDLTAEDVFYKADNTEVKADFMSKTFGAHGYYKGADFTRIDLPLKGQGAMSFVLPDKGVAVDEFLTSSDRLRSALTGGERDTAKVIFKMPKFKYGSEFKLADMLKKLGVKDMFDDNADFSALSAEDGLYVSDIIQQSHIGVDENGVEAAAYTMVMIAKMSAPIELEKTVEIKLDRPFMYSITAQDGSILFIGICDKP